MVRTSYWFLPVLMITAAIAGSLVSVHIDRTADLQALRTAGWIYSHSASGARALLEAVAGSMITTAGIAFSIMVVVLALAANQFGSRVLRNYMRDRGNQFTLGVFVATFVYCLMVMRTVRGNDAGDEFVPQISVLIAIVLAIGSVVVLVYFIHHTTQSIQSENILAAVAAEFRNEIAGMLPRDNSPADDNRKGELPADFANRCEPIASGASGYLQIVDTDVLLSLATNNDLYLEALRRPGDFVAADADIARYMCVQGKDNEIARKVRRAFVVGSYRTYLQDVDFGIQQIVLIMVRAMSPGIHDPFTAIACLDRLGESLSLVARRRMRPKKYFDQQGRLRLVVRETTLLELVESTLAPVRVAARDSAMVSRHFLRTVAGVAESAHSTDLRLLLHREAAALVEDCEQAMKVRSDLEQVKEEYRRVFSLRPEQAA